jgi:septal ring factor EnvC (AmiA/AmiB activator)
VTALETSLLNFSCMFQQQLQAQLEAWASETELIREGWQHASQALCAQILLKELPPAPPQLRSKKEKQQHPPEYLKRTQPKPEKHPHCPAAAKQLPTTFVANDLLNLKQDLVAKKQELKKAREQETETQNALEKAIEREKQGEKQRERLQQDLEKMHTELQRATSNTNAEREQRKATSQQHKTAVEANAQTTSALGQAIQKEKQSAKVTAELKILVSNMKEELARALHTASTAEAQVVILEEVTGKLNQSLSEKAQEHKECLGKLEKADADKKVLEDGLAAKMLEYMECLGKLEIAVKDNRALENRLAAMAEGKGAAVDEV